MSADPLGRVASRTACVLRPTGFVPDDWSDRRDALPQGCPLRDYAIEEVLGHGGFGIVYKARHSEWDQVAAIRIGEGWTWVTGVAMVS